MKRLWLSVCFGLAAAVAVGAEPTLKHVEVFRSGADGYHTYRIPAIEAAPDGSLVAFAEARKYNAGDPGMDQNDIDLVMKRSTDGGATWSAMKVIEDPGERWSAANPATVVDRATGRLWLLYLRSKPDRNTDSSRPGTDDMQTLARWSDDHGATWSAPIDLTAVARDMADPKWKASVVGPGGGIQDRDGRLVFAVWKNAPMQVLAIFSEDHGKTWHRGGIVPGTAGGDENQIVELTDGRLLMDFRQTSGPHRWFAESTDHGKTWSAPRPGIAVTPVCCAIERYMSKAAGDPCDSIVWTGPKGPGRANLVVRISYDEGRTFSDERLIAPGHAAYSDLTVLPDKTVGVLWERGIERGYQFITFTRLDRAFLAAPAQRDAAPIRRLP
jgi:hypothetical protein